MYPDVGPTAGGFVMTLKGRQFGTRDWGNGTVQVNIAGQPCTKSQWLSDNVIECIVPKGVGARHPVQVIVGGQIYPPEGSSEMLLFSYNAPIVLDVEPKNGPTDGDFDIVITGRNFGRMSHNPQPVSLLIICKKNRKTSFHISLFLHFLIILSLFSKSFLNRSSIKTVYWWCAVYKNYLDI